MKIRESFGLPGCLQNRPPSVGVDLVVATFNIVSLEEQRLFMERCYLVSLRLLGLTLRNSILKSFISFFNAGLEEGTEDVLKEDDLWQR